MQNNFNTEKLTANLEREGYSVRFFESRGDAADYLLSSLRGTSIGIGGSSTIDALDIENRLSDANEVYWHWNFSGEEMQRVLQKAYTAQVYMMSANAVAETGEIVNIDGRGNRLAGALYGHKKLIIVIGVNKICADLDSAIHRARNVAAPKNAQRLARKTPCAVNADRCYDCRCEDRICNALCVLWNKPGGIDEAEVIIINESLGY